MTTIGSHFDSGVWAQTLGLGNGTTEGRLRFTGRLLGQLSGLPCTATSGRFCLAPCYPALSKELLRFNDPPRRHSECVDLSSFLAGYPALFCSLMTEDPNGWSGMKMNSERYVCAWSQRNDGFLEVIKKERILAMPGMQY